jgi:ComF family protein
MAEGSGVLRSLLRLVMPQYCRECGQRLMTDENPFFCPACWSRPQRIRPPYCTVCGKPHGTMVGYGMPTNFPCAECRAKRRHEVRRVYAAAAYEGAVAATVKILKHERKIHAAPLLAQLVQEFVAREMIDRPPYDVLVPVPIHYVRQRERGFNHSTVLAHLIQPCFAPAAVSEECLARVRPTRPQQSLPAAERPANVRGAFQVPAGVDIHGKQVLLVDDVVTTGSTVSECAKALRRAGAAAVDVITPTVTLHVQDVLV